MKVIYLIIFSEVREGGKNNKEGEVIALILLEEQKEKNYMKLILMKKIINGK